jgi:protein phosphatase
VAQTVKFTCAGRTDVGVIRSGNEDNYLMVPERGVFIVADGMGGHAAGEVASEMAVKIIAQELEGIRGSSDAQAADVMRRAIREANGAIFSRTLSEHDKRQAGDGHNRDRDDHQWNAVHDRASGRQPGVCVPGASP